MMTVDALKEAHTLALKIEECERLAIAYRDAAKVTLGIPEDRPIGLSVGRNQITLTAAEIGDAVVTALDRRTAAMREKLIALGIES
jgi:hypothetical protein